MSTIKVNKIENTATADGGIAIDASGHVTVDGQQLPTAGPLSNRNLIINGAMNVAQRGTSVTAITSGGRVTVDRMIWSLNACGTWTSTQESDGPAGFANSFKMLCTTADASPAADDFAVFQYYVEAQDLQHLNYGTSDALSLTVSFYVKSNKTGTASFAAVQPDNADRQFCASYTINTANTWEYKTITIPADANGLINDDNGRGLIVEWWSNSGSTYTGGSNATSWEVTDDNNRNANNIGIGQAANDYFQITGLQLEVGEKATPFEHRHISDELARCERYFQTGSVYGYNSAGGAVATRVGYTTFTTEMRAAPTLVFSNASFANCSGLTTQQVKVSSFGVFTTASAAGNMNADFDYTADAEL
jgi:hypothetical protein